MQFGIELSLVKGNVYPFLKHLSNSVKRQEKEFETKQSDNLCLSK